MVARSSRISTLARHVKAATNEDADIEDIAKRAWPDAQPAVDSESGGCGDGCSSCGCGPRPSEQALVAKPTAATVPAAMEAPFFAWPRDQPVSQPQIVTAEDYIDSLRRRDVKVILGGEYITNFVDHPIVWPTVNSLAETYRLAADDPELGTAIGFSGVRTSRFLHVAESADDLVKQSKMQRELGRRTGCCFQRCVGMDALNAMWGTTYDIDQKCGTEYHARFQAFMRMAQQMNCVIGGAMTDPKGDRTLNPGQQSDPDLFVHVSSRKPDGTVYLRGAKVHQTGTLNSHFMLVMPGGRLDESEKDYAIACAIPVDAKGLTYIYGRQSCDLRSMEQDNTIDQGNAQFGAQETVIAFEDVEVPPEMVFMDGEIDFTTSLVERFTAYHRRSYICKAGLSDVMLGAAATISDYNGTSKASHIKDKLVEISYLSENIAGTALAASYAGKAMPAGNFLPDVLLANICKHNVTRFPYEIARMVQDIAGGLLVTLPGDKEFKHEVAGPLLNKFLTGKKGVTVENRRRILRLIECMTMGRNAIGFLSESMHGAGSPQAQRVLITRFLDLEKKKGYAKKLAQIHE